MKAERSRIERLAMDIPALWKAESTTNANRKEIIRCLVDRVVVEVRQISEFCDVTIHWKGGYTNQHEVLRPVQSYRQLRDNDQIRKRLMELNSRGEIAASIVKKLTDEGFSPPRRSKSFSREQIWQLLHQQGLTKK